MAVTVVERGSWWPELPTTPLLELARLEARSYLRSPALLVGVVLWLPTLVADPGAEEWVGSAYSRQVVGFAPVYFGTFLAATLIGLRDHQPGRTPVTTLGPLGDHHRTAARMVGGLAAVGVAAVLLALLDVRNAVAGGVAVGSTRQALPWSEHLLVLALVALAVASAVSAGQVIRSRVVVAMAGFLVIFVTVPMYWVVGRGPVRWFVPPIVGPQELDLPEGMSPSAAPDGWVLSGPGEFEEHWRRIVLDRGAVAVHAAYVVGLALLLGWLACRVHGRGRAARATGLAGLVLATGAGALQFAVRTGMPS